MFSEDKVQVHMKWSTLYSLDDTFFLQRYETDDGLKGNVKSVVDTYLVMYASYRSVFMTGVPYNYIYGRCVYVTHKV